MIFLPSDDPRLRQKSHPLDKTEDITSLIADMARAMIAGNGVDTGMGLSAVQIGEPVRLFLIKRPGKTLLGFANPVILSKFGGYSTEPEGCLSFPGRRADVLRANRISVEFDDPVTFMRRAATFNETTAHIFQHEVDHLDGITMFDKEDT